MIINEESIDIICQKLSNFLWTSKHKEELDSLRQQFVHDYDKTHINTMTKEDYYAGLGRKQGCMAYDLEWGTRALGSIKGGSKYKYGYEVDFPAIKSLLQKIVSIDSEVVYFNDGKLSKEVEEIAGLSKKINGFKTGRTVIPKLLSIYYPKQFLSIFNDQDHFLSKLTNEIDTENTGLYLYLEYNSYLLQVKTRVEEITDQRLDNDKFVHLLYHSFPKVDSDREIIATEEILEVQNVNALEVQHYQSLLHRNFNRLFPKLRYFDEEEQIRKNGQYDTQIVGIMDILAVDEKGDFVIIEIKRQATDKAIGQILRYMGWTQEELCKRGQKVSGIIVAERKDIQLDFALKVIPDVTFMRLDLTIKLEKQ